MMVFRGGAFGRYWGSDDGICCCCLVTKSCPALWDSVDCSPPGSSVHGISQVRILECIAISFSKGSSWPGDQTRLSCTGRRILYHWATREAPWSLTKRAQLSSLSSPHHMRMPWESSWLQARKRALTRTQPLLTSWSQTFSPYPCKKRKFCCLSHLIYSILLCQPEQIKSSNQQILTECHWAICQAWGT